MYENLLCLPYFQGMTRNNITKILDKTTIEYKNYIHGETIWKHSDKCDHFAILTKGSIACTTKSPDSTYRITEWLTPPYAIEPYSLFGYDTTYKHDYKSQDGCTILLIEKKFFFSELIKHDIFTINLLNLISRKAQRASQEVWRHTPTSIEGRISQFISTRCENPKGPKLLSIKMERLAAILCETRLNISKALNNMQKQEYIELHRGEIVVPSLERLPQI